MANEIFYSDPAGGPDLLTNGGAVAEVLSGLVAQQLYDTSDLRSVSTFIPYNTFGSTSMAVTQDAIPGAFGSIAENASVANTAYTTSEFTLAVSRYSRAYEITDLVGIAGSPVDLARAVKNLVDGVSLTFTDLICAATPGFTTQVNAAGPLDVDDIYDGQFALNLVANSGPYNCVLHPKQINEFRNSLRSEAGAMQFQDPTAEMLATKGPGFQGMWNNIAFYSSDSVTNAAGNHLGAMMSAGALAHTMAPVSLMQGHVPSSTLIVSTPELLVELSRDAYGAQSAAIAHMYPGVVLAEDARGVEILSVV